MTKDNDEKVTHLFRLRKHLTEGGTITAIEALRKFGCFRLAARVFDLKHRGMNIEKMMVSEDDFQNGRRYARYYLSAGPIDVRNWVLKR